MQSWTELYNKQPYVVTLLKNSLQKHRLSHAYLFAGGRGTGKLAVATMLAKSLFCNERNSLEPCQQCDNCRRIDSYNHPDVRIFRSEAGESIKVGQIDSLLEEFSYQGMESTRRLFIIEHANRMTAVAANRLLKYVEELSDNKTVIFITEQIQQMLPTFLSRCQIVSFKPLPVMELVGELEGQHVPPSLARLALTLTGDYDEAYEMAKSELFALARNLVIQLTQDLLNQKSHAFLTIHENWMVHLKGRAQAHMGLDLLLVWFRDVLLLHVQKDEQIVFTQEREQLEKYRLRFTIQQVARQMEAILEAKMHLDANVNPQLVIEQAVLKLQEG